jgi:L-lactate dehydrogenase complex protein LldE
VRIALFITCLTDAYYPRTGIAAVKVLEHLGEAVEFPREQTCCGQPMFNNGFTRDARELALRFIEVFEPFEAVVTPSGSCTAMIREHYAHLLADDEQARERARGVQSRTYEFCEFLTKVLRVDLGRLGVTWQGDVTAHSACHLRGLGLVGVAEQLLGTVPGLKVVPLEKSEQCCGFGGTFAVKYPEISGGMVADKTAAIKASGCRTVVCNEAGCGMNIEGACRRAGLAVRMTSAAEIIAEGLGLMERAEGLP